jgi:hypothetical protein
VTGQPVRSIRVRRDACTIPPGATTGQLVWVRITGDRMPHPATITELSPDWLHLTWHDDPPPDVMGCCGEGRHFP